MLQLEKIKTDIFHLLETSIDLVRFQAGEKNLELLLQVDQSLPRFVLTDPIRLKQVLANLLSNAVKFTQQGEIELQVKYEPLDGTNGTLSFFVRDTGIGITEKQREKLFKAFSQADSSTTRQFGGTGLGLIISELIVNKLGGKILVDSTEGEGTTFYFEIVTEVEDGDRLQDVSIAHITRCLIIDDNANNRLILEGMLTSWGVEHESCNNGLAALKLLETSRPFDAVICDYHMPHVDGLETIRMIREKLKLTAEELPVILLHSSSDDVELHRKCEELDIRFRLTKPVKSHDLHAYLSQVHGSYQKPVQNVDANAPQPAPAVFKSANILIAEDVPMNMLLIKTLIARLYPDVTIHEAHHGVDAVKLMKEVEPELIFMDVQMPQLDGLGATKQIRALEKERGTHVPIIALTAGALQDEKDKCIAAGMDDFLTKPLEKRRIQDVLEKYLARKKDTDHFCKETLLARTASTKLTDELIEIALSSVEARIEKMGNAINSHDTASILNLAHQLKGTAANLSCNLLVEILDAIEQIAIVNNNLFSLTGKFTELQNEWETVKAMLKE